MDSKNRKLNSFLLILVGSFFLIGSSFADNQAEGENIETDKITQVLEEKKVEKAVEALKMLQLYAERLNLSEEESEKLKEVIKENLEKRKKVLSSHGLEKKGDKIQFTDTSLSKFEKMKIAKAMKSEMKEIDKDALEKISNFLSKEQIKKYKKIKKRWEKYY